MIYGVHRLFTGFMHMIRERGMFESCLVGSRLIMQIRSVRLRSFQLERSQT